MFHRLMCSVLIYFSVDLALDICRYWMLLQMVSSLKLIFYLFIAGM